MVKPIVKDPAFLTKKSEPFDFKHDMPIIQDMLDTAEFHKENCAGLAAIQIGVVKRVILVRQEDKFIPFINPVIIKRSPGTYCAKEGCLSLDGARTVKRHYNVMVSYTDQKGNRHTWTFADRIAQIIQHEVDHLNGILIGKEVE